MANALITRKGGSNLYNELHATNGESVSGANKVVRLFTFEKATPFSIYSFYLGTYNARGLTLECSDDNITWTKCEYIQGKDGVATNIWGGTEKKPHLYYRIRTVTSENFGSKMHVYAISGGVLSSLLNRIANIFRKEVLA